MYLSAHTKRLACVAMLLAGTAGAGFIGSQPTSLVHAASTGPTDEAGCYRVLKDLPNITIRQGEPLVVLYCDNDGRLVSAFSRREPAKSRVVALADR